MEGTMRQRGDSLGWVPVPVHQVGVHLGLPFRHYLVGMVALGLLVFPVAWAAGGLSETISLSLGWAEGDPAIRRITNLLALAAIILVLGLVVNLQGRSLMSVVAPEQHLDLGMMARSAVTYGLAFTPVIVMAVMSGQLGLGDWRAALALLPMMLVLVALQATAEEMVCRGYMAQGFQVLFRHAALAALPVALIFLSLHDTGAWDQGWDRKANILMISLALSWLTTRAGRLEPAMGVHFAHNLIVFTLAARPDHGLPSVSGFAEEFPDRPFNANTFLAQSLVYGAVCANYWFIGLRTGFVEGLWRERAE
ncbi:type II CAAX endopeptidase family protein [Niveispirillum sp.]|uniref:type II CAAX endopeptidase family protein n=1 Tax=Niveispirillum sp. TaxID=1917217 RepID=UPI001B4DF84F|nr:type II CAAX endopeptidase family protein [Niveispirillum sp.]MBP7338062.1 CPBP family intramembrane metalloprotease [Niveispirillum sp.]